ncbi:MAG: acetylxylan esterase [Bryobacteraceae bacterium]|nr:acetylxylan esterase [Bryobacteraceae bacterium]
MTRREILALALAPQTVHYRTFSQALPDYLTRLARDAYTRRQRALDALTTPTAITARQRWARETFWRLTGGEPARTPLNLRTVGEFRRDGYRVEKIVYESQPGLVIPANLYLPDRAGRLPGVLFQLGHSLNGKAAEPYQKCCQGLARLGYVVLAFDPMGQGERTDYPRPNGGTLTRLPSADDEHTVPGRQLLLAGLSATQLQTWDAVRGLDVLAAHPAVDPTRLASTGTSGGGTLTMFLGAVDSRLACAAVSCGNTENHATRDFIAPGSVDDAEQNFIGGGPAGFDRWDTLYPLAPKPIAFVMSGRDFQGTYSPNYLLDGRAEFARLEKVYAVLGQRDRLRWVESPLPHNLSEPLRIEIYNWFGRWLQGATKSITEEPKVQPEPDETLWCGPTGNVKRDFGARSSRQLIPSLQPAAADWAALTGAEARPAARLAEVGETRFGPVRIRAIEVRSEPEVVLPAWLYNRDAKHCLLLLEDGGKGTRWQEGSLYHRLAQAGIAVCAADVRGLGDLRPALGKGAANYAISHFEEEFWAWGSLMLGKPLAGQRITDIRALVTALRAAGFTVELAASGRLVVPALLATVLEPAITRLTLTGEVPSYQEIAKQEEYRHPTADFLPGVLAFTDLPEVAKSLGARLRRVERFDEKLGLSTP